MIDPMSIIGKLTSAYKTMIDNGDYETIVIYLNDKIKIRSLVAMYIKKDTYTSEDKEIITLLVSILQAIYNNSNVFPPVPDDEYDQLYELFKQVTGDEIVGSAIDNVRDKVIGYHKYPDLRGTLDKVHFIRISDKKPGERRKSLEEWIKSVENRLGRKLTAKECSIIISPKWDGLSGIFECEDDGKVNKVLSRGDTDKNEAIDMTKMFKDTNMSYATSFTYGFEYGMKTEIIMSSKNFERWCKKHGDFKSARSAVSSILNSKELNSENREYLTIIPLQVQNFKTKEITIPHNGYQLFTRTTFPNIKDFDVIEEAIKEIRKEVDQRFGIATDGIVIRFEDTALCEFLGRDSDINKFEVAYKFPAEKRKTIIKNVEWSTGILGSVTPVAKVEPVKMKGNTIRSISLGSEDIFKELDLNKGDEVIIKYDVIPYLEKDETCEKGTDEKFEVPTHCNYCKEPLVRDPELQCGNLSCESRKIGKIVNYTERMRIPHISIGIITDLFNHGYLNGIEDLYMLKDHKKSITKLDGYGEKSFNNIIDGINSRHDVYDYELLASLGIPTIGERIFKKISNIYYLTELQEVCSKVQLNKLTSIGGIQEKTAQKIINGVNLNKDTIDFLCSILNVKRDERKYTIKVLFTKIRDKEFEKFLDSKGVLVLDNYSNDVDMVIVPSLNTSSSKVDKAEKNNKEVIAINDAYKMFGYSNKY